MVLRCIAAALVILALGSPALAQKPAASGAPRFQATFFQPLEDHANWPQERWSAMFDNLAALGVTEVIVQWSAYGGMSFFVPQGRKVKAVAVLEKVFPLARQRGMKVRLGLVHDPDWWAKITRPVAVVEVYLKRLELEELRLAAELHQQFKDDLAFCGWYLPQELDDVNWNGPRHSLIVEHLRSLRAGLKDIAPSRDAGVSGFVNGTLTPLAYKDALYTIMNVSGLEQFYLQDGVGVGKLSLTELPMYMEAAAKGVAEGGGRLRPVVEIFTQTHGEPIDKKPFQAEPASMSRVASQLAIAGRYAQAGIVAFSLPEYATPADGPLAAAFSSSYRQYLATGR